MIGSTTRGGVAALKAMIREIRSGRDVAFTPDGPRGPRFRVQPGIVQAAASTGVPILPVGYAVSRVKRLRSWDRFTIPKPFGRAIVLRGEPIEVPPDLGREEIERYAGIVERAMHEGMARARKLLGIETPAVPGR